MMETQILKGLYEAINRFDIPACLSYLDPEIERIEPPGFSNSGTFHGHQGFEKVFRTGRESWAEGTCEPEQIFTSGNKAVAQVHIHVRLKDKEDWIDARVGDAFVFRDGKILQFRTFITVDEALQWLKD